MAKALTFALEVLVMAAFVAVLGFALTHSDRATPAELQERADG